MLLVLVTTGIYFLMSSARFEGVVRDHLITEIEQATGGKVEIATFHWHLLRLEAEADGLVIHGRELQSEPPLGKFDRLRARVSLLGLWSPSVRLTELDIARPVFHLIIYPDGTTNLPKPSPPRKENERPIDQFFDMKVGHLSMEQGFVDIDNRAAAFDAQNRHAPLDLQANDVSLQLRYIAARSMHLRRIALKPVPRI